MKEVVRKIIETEREVRDRIERAHGQAQKIVRDSETSSRELTEERRQKAVLEAQELVERMKKEAEEEHHRQVEKVKGGSPELVRKKSKEIDRAVELVTALVIGSEG